MEKRCLIVLVTASVLLLNVVKSQYVTCGGQNSDSVRLVINATVNRLMELRNPNWGWINTPEAVLGLQLSAQRAFFARDRAVQQMEREIEQNLEKMNIGKLALYVLAVSSSCENPRNFSGKNLIAILERRSRQQFRYNGSNNQVVPFDRYYRMGLALGALCVSHQPAKDWVVRKILHALEGTNNFGGIHSADDAAQVLLALRCIEISEARPQKLMNRIKRSADKLAAFLKSSITVNGDNVWIGNKYSSPHSALALKEDNANAWSCKYIGTIKQIFSADIKLLPIHATEM